MKLLIILLCKGTSAPVAPPLKGLGGRCLVMHPRFGVPDRTTMKTKRRQLQRAFKTRQLSEATVRARSEILAFWTALKQL